MSDLENASTSIEEYNSVALLQLLEGGDLNREALKERETLRELMLGYKANAETAR